LIAACVYLDTAVRKKDPDIFRFRDSYSTPKYQPLLNIIAEACGFGIQIGHVSYFDGWAGLDEAINAIYNRHNLYNQSTNNTRSFASLTNPNSNDYNG
jgi:hypothetical protein